MESVRERRKIRSFNFGWDKPLLFTVLFLMVFGCLMVFSASGPYAIKEEGDAFYFFKRDIQYCLMGLVVIFIGFSIDYKLYRKHARLLYLLAWVSCLLVFVPHIGLSVNNARRWLNLIVLTYMPSDGLKIASIMLLSADLARPSDGTGRSWKALVSFLLFVAITILPVYFQPNFSAVMVLAVSLTFLYFIGGMRLSQLFPLLGAGLVFLLIAFWPSDENYRLGRVLIVLDPFQDAEGAGWQLIQSLYAVASGGLFGVGFGKSAQKFDYLAAEPHNDFIYSVIAEELGFFGALLVIVLFCYLAYRGLKIAREADSRFGRFLALGLTFVISFQAMVNIGVAIGLIPTTGITLPFVSYGGSSLLVMSFMIGILLNISRQKEPPK